MGANFVLCVEKILQMVTKMLNAIILKKQLIYLKPDLKMKDLDSVVFTLVQTQEINEKVGKAATVSDAVRTPHDPVIFDLGDEKLANKVEKFIDKLARLGSIRGKRNDVTDYEINVYEFMIWYNQ